jgi:hypothetical protein
MVPPYALKPLPLQSLDDESPLELDEDESSPHSQQPAS